VIDILKIAFDLGWAFNKVEATLEPVFDTKCSDFICPAAACNYVGPYIYVAKSSRQGNIDRLLFFVRVPRMLQQSS
jgi:hypothetical protein